MKWAEEMDVLLGPEEIKRIIWSDECYVVLGDRQGSVYVTRRPGEEMDENCVVPTFKQSNLRIMVWGCIMQGKKGPLTVLEYPGGKGGGMTAKRYQDQVLKKLVHDFYMEVCEERGWAVFEQDGAPSHRAKSTINWLEQNSIDRFPQPPSSPDVVPLENLWHTFKEAIRNRDHIPTSVDELKTAAYEAWESITLEEIDRHVLTMQDRVKAVLKAQGGHTGF